MVTAPEKILIGVTLQNTVKICAFFVEFLIEVSYQVFFCLKIDYRFSLVFQYVWSICLPDTTYFHAHTAILHTNAISSCQASMTGNTILHTNAKNNNWQAFAVVKHHQQGIFVELFKLLLIIV